MSDNKAIAWQADVYGQQENDLFLAREADYLLGTDGRWLGEMDSAYRHHGDDYANEVQEVVALIENALFDAGYMVEWDNGVHIYRESDYAHYTEDN